MRVAVVIGVGPGVGQAVARRFCREKYAVGLIARGEDKLKECQAELEKSGGRSLAVQADAGDEASMKKAFQTIRSQLGDPDVLVYNAGPPFKRASILDISSSDFTKAFEVQCTGALVAAKEVLPKMLERKAGTIIFTGATASLRGGPAFSLLAVPKFGLRALAQSIAREFQPKGIHVAVVNLDGQVDIPTTRKAMPDRKTEEFISPDAVAETYWQLHLQHHTAWTHELELRPAVERW